MSTQEKKMEEDLFESSPSSLVAEERSCPYFTTTIILDLDHTLIHSVKPEKDVIQNQDFTFTLEGDVKYNLYKRPYLHEFIKFCFEYFDRVIIWSAGTQDYVDMIVANCHFEELKTKNFFRVITRNTYDMKRKNVEYIMEHRDLAKSKVYFVDDIIDRIEKSDDTEYDLEIIKAPPFKYYSYGEDMYLIELMSQLMFDIRRIKSEQTETNTAV